MVFVKLSFVFLFGIVYCDNKNYTIEMHSIPTSEPYPTLYLQDNDTIYIACDDFNQSISALLVHGYPNGTKRPLSTSTYSTIFDAEHLNGDTLECIGKSNETGEKLNGIVLLLSNMNKAYRGWNGCNQEKHCLNRAQCYRDPDDTDIRLCVCTPNMGGYQCERTSVGVSKLLFGVSVMVSCIFILIAVGFAIYYKSKHSTEAKLRQHMICVTCNKNRAHPDHVDHAATTESTQTSNAVVFKRDYVSLPLDS